MRGAVHVEQAILTNERRLAHIDRDLKRLCTLCGVSDGCCDYHRRRIDDLLDRRLDTTRMLAHLRRSA